MDDPLDVLIDVEDRLRQVKLAATGRFSPTARWRGDRMLLAAGSACAAALVVYWRRRASATARARATAR